MLEDIRLTDEYSSIKLFNYKSDDLLGAIRQCKDSFIVVDNADNLMNDDVRRFINFEVSNQYMLFLRNCDGLNVSDKSFKVLKFDNNRITLEEELWYEIREEVLAAVENHRINLSKIEDKKTLHYIAGFKRYSTERVMKALVGEFT